MRILVVDDLEANRILLAHLIEQMGHVAMSCSSAEQGLSAYKTHGADLIFMDVVMPGIDGYVAAQQLKAEIGEYFVPIIFITALQDEDALVRCLEFGDDYLVRPFNQIMFNAKIIAHLRTINLHRKTQQQHQELTYLHSRLMQEQEMAQHVFDHATQVNYQHCDNIETYLSSCSQFNGDVLLIAKSPAGGVYIMLGDFTGHGLPAALGSLPLSQVFHSLVLKQLSVGDLAREMNRVLADFLPDYMFCAAVVAELNSQGDRLRIWPGGLHDSLILDAKCKVNQRIASLHMPLGILEDGVFDTRSEEYQLNPHDRVIFYTDGILEASNDQGAFFGRERFEAALQTSQCNIEKVRKDLHRFCGYQQGNETQDDDISLVCISAGPVKFNGGQQTGSKNNPYDINRAPVPWRIIMDLSAPELRLGSPVSQLVDMLGEATGLYSHKPVLAIILTEMFNNALDYGVLNLDSKAKEGHLGLINYYQEREKRLANMTCGLISIRISHQVLEQGGELLIKVQDSGAGFDYRTVVASAGDESHGRGLSLIAQLSENMVFTEQGSCISVLYCYRNN